MLWRRQMRLPFNYDLATTPPMAEGGLNMFAQFMDDPSGYVDYLAQTQVVAEDLSRQDRKVPSDVGARHPLPLRFSRRFPVRTSRRFWTAAFLAVPLALYAIIVILPLVYSFYFSLTNWNGFNFEYDIVWFDNFAKVFSDPLFGNAIKNTIIWTIAAVTVPIFFGLGLALLLHQEIRGANVYKSLFYLPTCLSLAVIGQVWIWIYQPKWGLLNLVLEGVGLEHLARAWLAKPDSALAAIIVAWAWQQSGLAMVIFLAGLTSVPTELSEAAQIDGANWQRSAIRRDSAAASGDGGRGGALGHQFAQKLRHCLHHDGWWTFPLVGHAGDVHVQQVVQEILHGLWQRDFGNFVPDRFGCDRVLLPSGARTGASI